jgi:predicted dehydrogenase
MIKNGTEPFLGVVLNYDAEANAKAAHTIQLRSKPTANGKARVGVLGAGNFARMVLIPRILENSSLTPTVLCSAGGVSAAHSGEKHGFARATTDENEVLSADDVDVVFSITQHNLHAAHVVRAIESGKHVFVEKPLCMNVDELSTIDAAVAAKIENLPVIMVGFNRRFSPLAQKLKSAFVGTDAPLTTSFRFNAGSIPAEHWTQSDDIGGGRIIGEACHAIDFVVWLTGSLPVRVYAESIGGATAPQITDDQCFITLRHANGSVSNIAYLAGGDKACPKERVEAFGGGRTAMLDDFRELTTYVRGKKVVEKGRQDKGHTAEIDAFAAAIAGKSETPIPWSELRATTLAAMLAVQSLREGVPFDVPV